MGTTLQLVEFSDDDLAGILDAMRALARARNGWINVRPRPQEDEELTELAPRPVPSPLGVFGRRRPIVVQGTWVPGALGRRGPEPTSVGLEHPAGRFAVRQLRERGVPLPDGWAVVVDHARRGLVLRVPEGDDPGDRCEEVLRWLLRAAGALAPDQVSGRWQAEVRTR